MPRKAREKNEYAIYHVTCRSISETLLFRDDEDKIYYLGLLKRYLRKYHCSLYAYCLMDNHLHLHLDPKGFDISTFMHSVNTAYVCYFNKKYKRHGHLFQGRFTSRVLLSDRHNLTVSAYIHNNPRDIPGYSGKEETYKFSSYGIYLGIFPDLFGIIDKSFIMALFNNNKPAAFTKKYHEFVTLMRDKNANQNSSNKVNPSEGNTGLSFDKNDLNGNGPNENENVYVSGREIILREKPAAKVISYISDKLMIKEKNSLAIKSRHKLINYRAFTAYVLRVLCGMKYSEICKHMYNITISGCSRLCSIGHDLINSDGIFSKLFDELVYCTI